jgi:hypothetical protein
MNNQGQVFTPRWGELKREAGANPARSRHCKGDAPRNMTLAARLLGRLEDADDPESGDLPVLLHQLNLRKIGDEAGTDLTAVTPSVWKEFLFFLENFNQSSPDIKK